MIQRCLPSPLRPGKWLSASPELPVTFSVATWNINSVRLRIGLVVRYLLDHQPDVLCLQETKCPDANFPFGAFRDAGYPHIAINGQKGYHGVAVVSRIPLATFSKRDFCAKGDARHLHVVLGGDAEGLELHNFYVPAGGDEPDPQINVKFAHKLAFVDEMVDWARHEKPAAQRAILVGDLNIAPLEHDVWSHKSLLNVVSHTPIEVDKLTQAQAAGPWVDALRKFVPDNEKLYTWWSYRSPDWQKANKGRRLDHMWVSPALGDSVKGMRVLRDARGWERPSDHAPVMIRLEL
jgi:exodeoxyribonuclease-3